MKDLRAAALRRPLSLPTKKIAAPLRRYGIGARPSPVPAVRRTGRPADSDEIGHASYDRNSGQLSTRSLQRIVMLQRLNTAPKAEIGFQPSGRALNAAIGSVMTLTRPKSP